MNTFRMGFCFLAVLAMPVSTFADYWVERTKYSITWLGVVDNGEGENPPHGPLGNLHVTVWDDDGDKINEFIIGGPTDGEFDDGDEASYSSAVLGEVRKGSAIQFSIWESDPGGPLFGRKHDELTQMRVRGSGTYHVPNMTAHWDAIDRALARNGNRWAERVWPGGIQAGIPMIFVKVETETVSRLIQDPPPKDDYREPGSSKW